jgi:undecaprenyl-diphosphatase
LDYVTLLSAILLGIAEGLTEFIPVSSTGHLILLGDLLGFRGPPGKLFEIVIQLGAILAVCWVYRAKLLHMALHFPTDAEARQLLINCVVAFLPAAVIGAVLHDFIKAVLFSPWVVSVSLVVGGLAILAIERLRPESRIDDLGRLPARTALAIGLCQTVAMIPGVSRSGATIMGALLLGVGRRAATEFSFFLAIPTMLGATAYDLFANWHNLDNDALILLSVGFATALVAGMAVVRSLTGFVSRNGFAPFGWYRIVVGSLMLILLLNR